MDHGEIIQALGGTGPVGRALGRLPKVVWRWRERGIPPRHWIAVAHMARERGMEHIDLLALATGYRPLAAEQPPVAEPGCSACTA